ncbi:hypothetical protein K1719_001347 [Acacia pycnantha]|nr:hypothetical protein K1719_001347 [Acacia pycnantha]
MAQSIPQRSLSEIEVGDFSNIREPSTVIGIPTSQGARESSLKGSTSNSVTGFSAKPSSQSSNGKKRNLDADNPPINVCKEGTFCTNPQKKRLPEVHLTIEGNSKRLKTFAENSNSVKAWEAASPLKYPSWNYRGFSEIHGSPKPLVDLGFSSFVGTCAIRNGGGTIVAWNPSFTVDVIDLSAMLKIWIILGDFDQILHSKDKMNMKVSSSFMSRFLNCIDHCNLIHLNQKGPKFTWTNNRKDAGLTMEKLDMAFGNLE